MALLFVASCHHKPDSEWKCSSRNPPSFKVFILPIVQTHCISGCHDTSGSYSSVLLDTRDRVKKAIDQNHLLDCVKQNGLGPAMPQGQPKLSEKEIELLECWNNHGSPE